MGVLNNELTINTELQTENFTAQSSAESHEEMFTIIQKLHSSEINLDHSRKYISYHLQHQITIFHVVVMSKLS